MNYAAMISIYVCKYYYNSWPRILTTYKLQFLFYTWKAWYINQNKSSRLAYAANISPSIILFYNFINVFFHLEKLHKCIYIWVSLSDYICLLTDGWNWSVMFAFSSDPQFLSLGAQSWIWIQFFFLQIIFDYVGHYNTLSIYLKLCSNYRVISLVIWIFICNDMITYVGLIIIRNKYIGYHHYKILRIYRIPS